jgi:hypothetical protein
VLALFTFVSSQPQWLRCLPLLATVGWLFLTRKLLLRMGASPNGAMLLIGLTAASPLVVFLATNLMPATLFALLATACLLVLLDDRDTHAAAAGVLAGLATLAQTEGVALIAACILTLAIRRRFRSGLIFTAIAVAVTAPWFGWSLAHAPNPVSSAAYGVSSYASLNIFTSLAANEKLVVFSRNLIGVFGAPWILLTGFNNLIALVVTFLAFAVALFVRRQLVPDLFAGFYCLLLLFLVNPPSATPRLLAAILPLLLWIVWRVFQLIPLREAVAGAALVAALLPLWADAIRIPATRTAGFFEPSGIVNDNWKEMQKLFAAIRSASPSDSVLLANLDATFYLYTGRKTIRGFVPNTYSLYYSPKPSLVTPDRLLSSIRDANVSYVVVTPDRDFAEAPLFSRSVEALERGGILEPVDLADLPADYRLLRVARLSF